MCQVHFNEIKSWNVDLITVWAKGEICDVVLEVGLRMLGREFCGLGDLDHSLKGKPWP